MMQENLIERDWFNYYSIKFLEIAGCFAPKQQQIDRVESLLKDVVATLGVKEGE